MTSSTYPEQIPKNPKKGDTMSRPKTILRNTLPAVVAALMSTLCADALAVATIVVIGNNVKVQPGATADWHVTGANFPNTLIAGQVREHEFRIRNTGDTNLIVTAITLGGSDPGEFSLAQNGAVTIAAGRQSIFYVNYDPTGNTVHNATVTIASNATNASSFVFPVQGFGTNVLLPNEAFDAVGFFSQPVKVKCKDGQCVASGTIFVANPHSLKNNSVTRSLHLTTSLTDFVDFSSPAPIELEDVTLDPAVADKPLKFQKIKFAMPVPEGPIKIFGALQKDNSVGTEANQFNNLFSTDVFVTVP